jgi:O-antigen biosynthesis protein
MSLTGTPLNPAADQKIYLQLVGQGPLDIAAAMQSAGLAAVDLSRWTLHWLAPEQSAPLDGALLSIERHALLPKRWLARLLQMIPVSSTALPLSTLCATPGLKIGQSTKLLLDAPTLDAWCAVLAADFVYVVRSQVGLLSFVPQPLRAEFAAGNVSQMHCFCGMYVGSRQPKTTEHELIDTPLPPWFVLADRIEAMLAASKTSSLLVDPRPRLLHALHDWGGGVLRFAEDYARADVHYRHLWLVPKGRHGAKLFGNELTIFDPLDGVELARATITPAIASVDRVHAAFQASLQRFCAAYQISLLLVSSTIGQALALFRTGLPTAVVLHDYFPLWPKLHCDFGDPTRRFDAAELAQDIAQAAPFARAPLAQWQRLRDDYVAALLHAKVALIAPSQSVLENSYRLAPELRALNAQVIAHGLQAFVDKPQLPMPAPRKKLRVLVPGRIAGGKGADLLKQALPGILQIAELFLLGAKEAGSGFLAHSGVHVISDYTLANLPKLVQQIAPDLALLPRTVAETFSYSLSEMWALQLPVLATNIGALAERIRAGENGFLCAPAPDDLVSQLTELARRPELLARVRSHLRQITIATPADQAARYQALFAQLPGAAPLPATSADVLSNTLAALQTSELVLATTKVATLQLALKASQQQAIARGEWGHGLQTQLSARSRWANQLASEVDRLHSQTTALQDAHKRDLTHYQTQIAELLDLLNVRQAQLEQDLATQARLEQDLRGAQQRFEDILASTSWRYTEPLRRAVRLMQRVHASIRFQLRRSQNLFVRGLTSLKTRGVSATLKRLLRRDAPLQHPVTLALPETPEVFAPYTVFGTAEDSDSIDVSVIIPIYNKFHYTDVCLRALSAAPCKRRVEIIVVDDCSTDESWDNLNKISGIRALKNAQNLGFIGACNAGLAAARGEFVVFLNNDTAVQAGWLDALIDTFSARPDAGLVGAMLVYPDGRLQESGGIIFSDGSGWNYGRFADPNDPQYGFVREVDYCSGAAIALRKTQLDAFGGFDTLYTPAYYEDTDLAFKVRASGQKCYVQPASRVVHFEGISSGTDISTGIKRFQVINQEKFLARWAQVLTLHPPAPPKTPIAIASQHRAQKFVLVIDAVTPMPDQDSGSLRMVNLLTILVQAGCAVTFFCEGRHYHAGYAEKLQQLGVQVLYHPYLSSEPSWLAEHGARFDAVMLSRHYIAAPLLALVRSHCRRARVLFDTVDVHFLREQRQAELSQDIALKKSAEHTKAQELAVIAGSDITLVVSPIERDLLKQLMPAAKVEILSNIHDVPGCAQGFAARADLLFVGGFQHPPNVDAVLWFVQQVWPKVQAALPEIKLHLVGSNTPNSVQSLASEQIIVHGFVPDIDPILAQARLSIAPLRYGAGVKGKVNMAMAHGLPVIATGAAVEGMYCTHGEDVLIGDSADAFADALVRAYQDPALWQRLSAGGLHNVSTHFSFAAAKSVIERIFALTPSA